MANELPEVVPEVQSMPTTGWFCQTDGAARRRITKNTSSFPNEGTFDVTGVPGHSHNANAVVSVDANYSKYRTSAITIPARVWSAAALAFPVGLLTDSEVVDNESERYDRAIERCVGYTALFPENCTGHIREPTRSIGEVRTLVAPKARLDTLTYVEDRAGWRVPNDGDDVKEQTERDAMVSDFPDIYIDVRPNTQVLDAATINGGVAPSSLYLESATYRYSIESADDEQTIGTLADDSAWDGTLRFVWDNDNKRYSTIEEVTVKLTNVATRAKADGAVVQANGVNQVYAEGAAHPSIMVKFPIMYTSKAFSGYCWLSHLDTEQSITYATRLRGADQSKRIEVDVIGISNDQGPFKWIGMPAYRIPVGGSYAHPGPDILQELHGDGTHTDCQTNFYDKYDAFTADGILRYHVRHWIAELAHVVAGNATSASMRSEHTFDFQAREDQKNAGFFQKRDNSAILGQLTATMYNHGDMPDFNEDLKRMYHHGALANQNLAAATIVQNEGMSRSMMLARDAPPIAANEQWDAVFSGISLEGADVPFTSRHKVVFNFGAVVFGNAVDSASYAVPDDKYAVVPFTPLIYFAADGAGDFRGPGSYLSTVSNGNRIRVPKMICRASSVSGKDVTLSYDLTDHFPLDGLFCFNQAGNAEAALDNYHHLGTSANPLRYHTKGFSLWLHADDGGQFDPTEPLLLNPQTMRNEFRDGFGFGNMYEVPADSWAVQAAAGGNPATLYLNDFVFAWDHAKMPYIFLETSTQAGALNDGAKYMIRARVTPAKWVRGLVPGGVGDERYAAVTKLTDLRQYSQADGNVGYSVPTLDQMSAANIWAGKDLVMYIPGYQFYETHVNAEPFAAIQADSNRLGPVFQSIKRISQHICAPVLNPNLRIESKAPLNHDTRHLPPELRDFRLQLQDIDWSRLRSDRVSINEMTLYEFKGGVQVPGAQQNILYLPEFRETKRSVSQGSFDITVFSELGCPSYFAFFCRNETTDILQQPLIRTLSIKNETTKKKSNTVTDMTIGQLYHLTQRNVHPSAEYDRNAFNRRQTILLSAEDVGLLGLKLREYQSPKRVEYRFSGTTDSGGNMYVVLVYNNRGLHIDGRRLQVVTLHE